MIIEKQVANGAWRKVLHEEGSVVSGTAQIHAWGAKAHFVHGCVVPE